MTVTAAQVSAELQEIARATDKAIEDSVGSRQPFMLLVWAGGEVSYVSTERDHARAIKAMEELIGKWKAGLPDTPAHERH